MLVIDRITNDILHREGGYLLTYKPIVLQRVERFRFGSIKSFKGAARYDRRRGLRCCLA